MIKLSLITFLAFSILNLHSNASEYCINKVLKSLVGDIGFPKCKIMINTVCRSQLNSSTKTAKGLKISLAKLFPKKKYQVPETSKEAIALVDAYFDSLIKSYPQETRKLLKAMYYQKKYLKEDSLKLFNENSFASYHVNGDLNSGMVDFSVSYDSRLKNTPILFKLNLIHEVAVHVGQAHQRVSQFGLTKFAEDLSTSQWNKFTEFTAAAIEKDIFDLIPAQLLEEEIKNAVRGEYLQNIFFNQIKVIKSSNFDEYVSLKARGRNELTSEEHEFLLSIYRNKESINN